MIFGIRNISIAFLTALLWSSGPVVALTGSENLERFFSEFRTLRADFTQIVLDQNLVEIQESSGRLWISRPDKFRWDYNPPFEQEIVGNGSTIWIYDRELEQVTMRDQRDAFTRIPALLLAGDGDVGTDFLIRDLGVQGAVSWVSLEPKLDDGSFTEIQLGFEDDNLRLIQLLDQLDQVTRIILSHVEENPDISSEQFEFSIPPGVDVLEGGL